jgi:hypothetical protein
VLAAIRWITTYAQERRPRTEIHSVDRARLFLRRQRSHPRLVRGRFAVAIDGRMPERPQEVGEVRQPDPGHVPSQSMIATEIRSRKMKFGCERFG